MWVRCQSCWERCARTTKNGEVQPLVVLCALICRCFADCLTSGLADSDFLVQTASVVAASSISLILSLVWCKRARTWTLSYFTCVCGSSSGSDLPGQKVRKTVSVSSCHLFFIPASLLDVSDCQRLWRLSFKGGGNMNSAVQLPVQSPSAAKNLQQRKAERIEFYVPLSSAEKIYYCI